MATREVVVDQKPNTGPPEDPNVIIPESVQRAKALAESYYQQPQQEEAPSAQGEESQAQEVAQEPQVAQPEQSAPAEASPAERAQQVKPPYPEHGSWEDKYNGMRGRYDAAQRTIGEMQDQMSQLGDELMRTQALLKRPQQSPPPQSLVTQQDVQNFGPELLDFTQRAAVDAVQPRLQEMRQENERLKQELERNTKRTFNDALSSAMPDWREIDNNPRWRQWLSLPDLYSNQLRQTLLQDAIRAGDVRRVIGFFNGFLQEEQATGHTEPPPPPLQAVPQPRVPVMDLASLSTPGRAARPASGGGYETATNAASDKPVITRQQIADFYANVRRGYYDGRKADYDRDQNMIFAAQREGRIR
jgi:hypothetical protein